MMLAGCNSAPKAAEPVVDPMTGPVNPDTHYSFLSTPDFLNADIADVSETPLYKPGSPNSITDSLAASLETVLDKIASEGVPDVYVAGDLVEGRWGIDTAHTGTFGPVDSRKHRREAIERAGDHYYQSWLEGFTSRGLNTFPALGDHDIGDDEWGYSRGEYPAFKMRNLEVWKQTYERNIMTNADGSERFPDRPPGPAHGTAYAVRPDPEVQLIAVDVFKRTPRHVRYELDDEQLVWLEGVLSKAVDDGVDWIMVQGHTPVVTPVRMVGSSGLMYSGGIESPFWQLMKRYGVDLYLCGEVHITTMHHVDGITQISHGGLFAYGFSNYMRADIDGGTMTLTSKRFESDVDKSVRLWQTDEHKGMPAEVVYESEPRVRGTLTLTSDNRVLESTGNLQPYKP
jgi:hypothetical protein